MKNIKNIEIIQVNTKGGRVVAIVSYQDITKSDLNDGYDTIEVPFNIRELQLSVRGNVLVDQSAKEETLDAKPTKSL